MKKAMENVEKHYAVVGILSELNKTLTVLEHYVPRFFKGALETYWSKSETCIYLPKYLRTATVLHTTVGPVNVYKNIRGTDLVVFVLILFPQMSNILLLKSVPLAQPQISNKIMCPYYPYVVLYIS